MPCPSLVLSLGWKGCFGQEDKFVLNVSEKGQGTGVWWTVYQANFPLLLVGEVQDLSVLPIPVKSSIFLQMWGMATMQFCCWRLLRRRETFLGTKDTLGRHPVKPTTISSVSDWAFILLFFLFLRLHTFPKHPKSQELRLKICWNYWKNPLILLDEAKIAFQGAGCIKLFNSNAALPVWCKAAASAGTIHLHHAVELAVGASNHCPYQCMPMWQNFHHLVLPLLSNRMGLRLFFSVWKHNRNVMLRLLWHWVPARQFTG